MLPLVSVIMPSYNGGKYIKEAIESVLAQTYENFELLIIEDCSTDNSVKYIKEYQDSRIRLIINETNRGVAYSTNRGIELAKGKYIALLDDDDIATQDRLKLQVEYLEQHKEIDILGGRTNVIDENGNVICDWGPPRNNPNFIKAKLLFEMVDFGNSSVMIRKEFIENNHLRYKDGYLGMQDFRFYVESSKLGKISAINEVLLKHRMHENCETKRQREEFQIQREKVYAGIQKESLEMSGYVLEEYEIQKLNCILKEEQIEGYTWETWKELYQLFAKILEQARCMEVDYYKELKTICMRKLRMLYDQMELFPDL